MADTWLTIEQAAVTLGLSVRTVNRHISSGKLQSRLHEGRREVLVIDPSAKADAPDGRGETAPSALSGNGSGISDPEPMRTSQRPSFTTSSAGSSDEPSAELDPEADIAGQPDYAYAQSRDPDRHERVGESATMLMLAESARDKAELAVRAYQTLARGAEVQVMRSQRAARFAWSVVGLTVVAVVIAVGWTTKRLTTVEINYDNLQKQMNQVAVESDKIKDKAERDVLDVKDRTDRDLRAMQGQVYEAEKKAARAEGHASALADAAVRRPTTTPTTNPSIVERLTSLMEKGE